MENLYILNLNEAAIHLDERVTVEMQRLRIQAVLQLSYTPLYKIDPRKIKLAFNNARSLHKHFKDIQWETNVCWLQMLLILLNLDCEQGMKMFILPSINLVLLDKMKQHMKLGHIMDLLCMYQFLIIAYLFTLLCM